MSEEQEFQEASSSAARRERRSAGPGRWTADGFRGIAFLALLQHGRKPILNMPFRLQAADSGSPHFNFDAELAITNRAPIDAIANHV